MTRSAGLRVLIVDDQPVVRAGVARILGAGDGFDVVGECSDGDEVLDAVHRVDPDLVVMDIRMQRTDGVTAIRLLRDRLTTQAPPVLTLTTFDDDDVLWGAIEAGAAGFILKDAPAEDLIGAARAVAGGAAWLDPKIADRVLARLQHSRPSDPDDQRMELLSERELDVLREMARGATNAQIASTLHVSEPTVKSHIGALFAKLGVAHRAAAIVFAYDHGIVVPGGESSWPST